MTNSAARTVRTWVRAVLAVTGVLIAGVSLSAATATARPPQERPTIVLVHGAWADASSWRRVVRQLHDAGYRTVAPTLGLDTVAGDVATVTGALDAIPGEKVVVAHSYGGVVAAQAAAGRSDVDALVFTAAFVPATGDSIASLATGFQSSAAFGHLAFTGAPFASPSYIAPNYFAQFFAQDLTPTRAALLNAAQQPLNFPIVLTPAGPVGWGSTPSWYAVSGADRMIDPAEERWMAQRAGAHTIEFAGASHVGGITRYAKQFTALIQQAVRATRH